MPHFWNSVTDTPKKHTQNTMNNKNIRNFRGCKCSGMSHCHWVCSCHHCGGTLCLHFQGQSAQDEFFYYNPSKHQELHTERHTDTSTKLLWKPHTSKGTSGYTDMLPSRNLLLPIRELINTVCPSLHNDWAVFRMKLKSVESSDTKRPFPPYPLHTSW